jgi:hypothetical protein
MAQQTFEELVAAVKQAESRGKRYAADGKTLTTSPKGALGEMQVMPKTITDPGFGVAPARDKSPDEIARVGVDYLQAMKQKYGDTEKALIAYNWGPGSTDKWLAAGADPKKLPQETKTYVERVKGFLGKDVPRETMAKKEREPLPPSLPPMAQADQPTPTKTAMAKLDVKAMPASYQAAFALAALADAQDEEGDKVFNENKSTETEEFFANYKPVNKLASLDLSVTPVMMAEGGDVSEAKDTARKGQAYQELEKYLESRGETPSVKIGGYMPGGTNGMFTSDNLNIGSGTIRISKDTAKALVPSVLAHEMTHAADRQMKQQAIEQGMFGNSNQFTEAYEKMVGPEGRNRTLLLRKRYPEFEQDNRYYRSEPKEVAAHGVGAYAGPNIQDRAPRHVDATAATEFQILMDLAQRNVDKGPKGLEKIPAFFRKIGRYEDGGEVHRAEGSPPTGERKLDRETITLMRGEGMQPAAMQRVKPPLELNPSAAGLPGLMMYNDPSLPGTGTAGYVMVGDDNAKNPAMAQAMFLNPKDGNKADTIAHETEHLLARQNLGRGSNINTKFDELIGDNGLKRIQFVQKAVQAAPYLKEKYGLQSAYFQPEMVEFQGRRAKNLLYEQLASLAALEQRHKVDLTKDEELRKTLFARPDVRETYNALTGLRQTRLDPRDLPPHTRVPEPGILDAIKGVFKRAEGGPVYRADGSPEEGERLTPQQIERLAMESNTPATVNPNIQRQGEAARRLAAMRDVNTLPDPKTYAVASGLLGTRPDEMGFSVLHPKAAEIRAAANPAFAAGTALQIAPALQALGLGKVPGVVGGEINRRMLAGESLTPGFNTPAPINFAMKPKGGHYYVWPESSAAPEKSQVDAYLQMIENRMDKPNAAVADWIKSKVGRYIRSDFATEQDQMVKAAEEGKKLHFTTPRAIEESAPIIDPSLTIMRKTEGFPSQGFAKTGQGRLVEDIVDSSVWPATLDNTPTDYIPSALRKFKDTDPNMRLYEFPDAVFEDNLKITNLANQMDKMMTEKTIKLWNQDVPVPKEYQLDTDTLKGLTPAQASNRVAMKEEWLAKKEPEVAGQALAKDPQLVSHRYDNGSKWISPADLSENDMHRQMVNSIGCRGGWCTDKDSFALDYGSGDNRLHILLDKGFQPRAQLTMSNRQGSLSEFLAVKVAEDPNYNTDLFENLQNARASGNQQAVYDAVEAFTRLPEYLDWSRKTNIKQISEIKGQFNKEDLTNQPYLKEVQDFVKRQGPELQSVENLDGIGMTDISSHIYPNRAFKAISTPGKKGMKDVYEEAIKINGNSAYIEDDPAIINSVIEKAVKNVFTPKPNAARQIQMNFFEPPAEKAYGGMIERQPTDNRRYL